jgi:cell division protease FtsH
MGDKLLHEKRYSEAAAQYNAAIEELRKEVGNHPELALALRGLGHSHYGQQQYAEAESCYKDELSVRQLSTEQNNVEDICWCHNNMGGSLEAQGKYHEAIAAYKEGLALAEQVLPANHDCISYAKNGIKRCEKNKLSNTETKVGEVTTIKEEDRKTLADVAGCDEAVAKFRLVVNWIRDAKAYKHFGAKLPKGVLLSGPPGTGKTLLARAVAGEVGGSFFQASASEFIEMYVGVGASRVRTLFKKAKDAYKKTGKPSIVFIDEIDAVGKKRSDQGLSGDGERDQTVNQLLSCIQGFDPDNGTLVIAATNRPETLDSALTRSGRFDYKIEVGRPDKKGRKAIFGVHSRKVQLEPGVDRDTLFEELAGRARDFTGADIELAVNEAVTRAASRNAPAFAGKSESQIAAMPRIVTAEDFRTGLDQVLYGEAIRSKVRSDSERRATAVHEIGHAAIPTVLNDDPVTRITIVMTTKALGLMENAGGEERYGWDKQQFLNRIKTMLAGRIAEEEIEHSISTGASNDFERASQLARQMVGSFGMSEELGPVSIPLDQNGFPRGRVGSRLEKQFDAAWRKIITDCERETRAIIKQNAERIKYVASVLLEEETISGDRFRELWNKEPAPSLPATPVCPPTVSAAETTSEISDSQ